MGNKRRLKRRKNRSNQPRKGEPLNYSGIIKENATFEAYYKAQKIVPDDEWDDFMRATRDELPSSFRINRCLMGQTEKLKAVIMDKQFTQLVNPDGSCQSVFTTLPWDPAALSFQLNYSRVEIRKSESLQRLHSFLLFESENGYITRQETVSMIPPLVLDVKPHHKVLDACAAPGSKTAQIIEMLESDQTKKGLNSGIVLANDIDNRRCYMLVHQSKRLHSSCFVISNNDASIFPNLDISCSDDSIKPLKFDRILCDAPCTGDGTIRKNIDVWRKWSIANGNNFHGLQLRIAKRSLELLAKDGLMVYSTCSLNPLEDESVIASILNQSDHGVELVDVSEKLKGLKYKPGLSKWVVMQKDKKIVSSMNDVDEKCRTQVCKSMFPPSNVDELQLSRCIRILPHQQNTGGFFVAVLRKKVETLPWERLGKVRLGEKNEEKKEEEDGDDDGDVDEEAGDDNGLKCPPTKKPRKYRGFREDPFYFLTEQCDEWKSIKNYFKISNDFPVRQLATRSLIAKRNIYFLSESARNVIVNNKNKIKFINAGVKVFTRADDKIADCSYRITQEGIATLLPYLDTNTLIELTKDDLITLTSRELIHHEELKEATIERLKQVPSGSCVCVYRDKGDEEDDDKREEKMVIPICCWKGMSTLRAFLQKSERMHFLRICGVDTAEMEQQKIDKFKEKMQRKMDRINERATMIKEEPDRAQENNSASSL